MKKGEKMKLYEMTREQLDTHWLEVAKKQLLFKRIVNVRYLTKKESEDMGWSGRPIAFQLNDGNWIYPSADDEGNEGGSLFTSDDKDPILPLLR
jgi:hypothetical protein